MINIRNTWVYQGLLFGVFVLAGLFHTVNMGQLDRGLPFNAATYLFSGFFIACSLFYAVKRKELVVSRFSYQIICILFVMVSPMLINNTSFENFLPRLWMMGVGVLFLLSLYQVRLSPIKILMIILVAALVQACIGILQVYFLPKDNFLSYNINYGIPQGIFSQKNVYASFITTGFAVAGFLLCKVKTKSTLILVMLSPLLFIPQIILSASKTNWISLIVVSVLILFSLFRIKYKNRVMAYLTLCLLSLSILFIPTTAEKLQEQSDVNPEEIVASPLESRANDFGNLSGRTQIYPQVFALAVDNLPFGIGFGNIEIAYIEKTAELYASKTEPNAGLANLEYPHNELLLWFAEGGVISLSALLLLMIITIIKICKVKGSNKLLLLAIIFPIFFHSMTEQPFYSSFIHFFLIITLLYMIDCYSNSIKIRFNINHNVMKFLLSFIAIVVLWSAIVLIYSVTKANLELNQFVVRRNTDAQISEIERCNNNFILGNRFETFYNIQLSYVSILDKNKQGLLDFVAWAEKENQIRPKSGVYYQLIKSYLALGDTETARKVAIKADYLFPKSDFMGLDYTVRVIDN